MSQASATVVVPTLAADAALSECLQSLQAQTRKDFDVIVVDNSGTGRARKLLPEGSAVRLIENTVNVGFGGAINQGIEASNSRFVAALNDDAIAQNDWLEAMLHAIEAAPDVGMCASQVRLQGSDRIDSAGMLIALDGSSTQRGHGTNVASYAHTEDVLFASGSAALYRRTMLDEIGAFDADFFLYCEDTDLGLRARWAGWRCLYVANAVVEHKYSHSAGRASALKAFYVERNRLYVAVKNFPLTMLVVAPFASALRYLWHALFLLQGRGKAAEFAGNGGGPKLAWFVARAHLATAAALPSLLRKRRQILRSARLNHDQFSALLREHRVSLSKVAAH